MWNNVVNIPAFAEHEESGDGSGGVVEKENHTVLISQLFVFMLRLRSRDYSLVCVFPTGEMNQTHDQEYWKDRHWR